MYHCLVFRPFRVIRPLSLMTGTCDQYLCRTLKLGASVLNQEKKILTAAGPAFRFAKIHIVHRPGGLHPQAIELISVCKHSFLLSNGTYIIIWAQRNDILRVCDCQRTCPPSVQKAVFYRESSVTSFFVSVCFLEAHLAKSQRGLLVMYIDRSVCWDESIPNSWP